MSLEEDKYSRITLNKIFNVFNSVADTVIVSTKRSQATSSDLDLRSRFLKRYIRINLLFSKPKQPNNGKKEDLSTAPTEIPNAKQFFVDLRAAQIK